MARKVALKKVMTKGSVIPKAVKAGKEIDPNEKWLKMKADFDLEDDEMPPKLAAEIANWNARPKNKTGLSKGTPNKPLNHVMQAEATLKSLAFPLTPQVVKVCKCGELFRTAYEFMSYCSDFCRMEGLSALGIEWLDDQWANKNEVELWMGSVPPGVIPQAALAVMKYLVLDSESQSGVQIEPWNPNARSQAVLPASPVALQIPALIPVPVESIPLPETASQKLARLRARTIPDTPAQ